MQTLMGKSSLSFLSLQILSLFPFPPALSFRPFSLSPFSLLLSQVSGKKSMWCTMIDTFSLSLSLLSYSFSLLFLSPLHRGTPPLPPNTGFACPRPRRGQLNSLDICRDGDAFLCHTPPFLPHLFCAALSHLRMAGGPAVDVPVMRSQPWTEGSKTLPNQTSTSSFDQAIEVRR